MGGARRPVCGECPGRPGKWLDGATGVFSKAAVAVAVAGFLLLGQSGKAQPPSGPAGRDGNPPPANRLFPEVTVTTDKAAYAPGSPVVFSADRNLGGLGVRYWHLGRVIRAEGLPEGTSWTWTPPRKDFQGYCVEIVGRDAGGALRTVGSVAVDVSSDWTRFPRYGFLSEFGGVDAARRASVIGELNRFHINGIQYYDWMHDHHRPLAGTVERPAAEWPNIIGARCEKEVVQGYIEEARKRNIASMFYDLCLGVLAWAEEDGVSPSWSIYKDASLRERDVHSLSAPFRSGIFLVDPGNEGWLDYFAEQVDGVYAVYGFDGFHIDQLGDRGPRFAADGARVDLPAGYGKFLGKMKRAQPGKKLAFNAVDRHGQAAIAAAPSDFLYNEVWRTGFGEIASILEENRSLAPGKNTVLAAYVNYKQSGTFNTPAVLLADAVIFALGGSHLELGEHMLCNEYFPDDALRMPPGLHGAMVRYYDFLVAYENLLRDGAERIFPALSGGAVELAAWGPVQGCVNHVAFRAEGKIVIHLLNFAGATHLDWRDDRHDQAVPPVFKNFGLAVRTFNRPARVWMASPDIDGGVPRRVEWTFSGTKTDITVPSLCYWTMIVIEPEEGAR